MINTLEIEDILYVRIKTSALKLAAKGGLYKRVRPVANAPEDIIINCLPVDGYHIQRAIANVNIYVADLYLKIDNVLQYVPDDERLKTLCVLGIEAIENVTTPLYFFSVENQSIFHEREINQHFINIRIEFRNINL